MIFRKFGAWLLTESGKSFSMGCATVGTIILVNFHLVPQTILLNTYKDIIHFYKHGFTLPVPQPLRKRFNEALELLEIEKNNKRQFVPFMVTGFDIYSFGSYYTSYGSIIGLPINFTYIDEDIIDNSPIRIFNEPIAWDTEEAKMLLKSLTISENGQIYAIAREIQMRSTPKFYLDINNSMFNCIAVYSAANYINRKFDYYAKPRSVRFVLYFFIASMGLLNYFFLKDFYQMYFEKRIDQQLKNKSPIFKEGGKDFYIATLNKNIALRTLMGKVGPKKFTQLGNENSLLRQKHLPLLQRKEFFENEQEFM